MKRESEAGVDNRSRIAARKSLIEVRVPVSVHVSLR